jgi:Ca-activated chloride channel family protein
MFRFQHIEFLLVLAAIPLLIVFYYLLITWKKNAAKRIGDPSLVKQLIQGFSSKMFAIKFILILLGFSLCAFAVADLVKPIGTQKINRKGIDVMIALDVSNSMLAEDIKPNRLERAKQLISKIIDKLSDDKVGIVIFAGKAYLQMPLTTDHSAAKMYLSSASTDNVPTQGTVINQALKMSYAAFNAKEKKYRSIILISDGEDHDEDAVKVTKKLAEEGVMVNTIGMGSQQGAPILDKETNQNKVDENGNTVITKLNEEGLKIIAQNGNGLYQLFTSSDEVADNIHKKLLTIGQTTLTGSSFGVYKNYFWYFLFLLF